MWRQYCRNRVRCLIIFMGLSISLAGCVPAVTTESSASPAALVTITATMTPVAESSAENDINQEKSTAPMAQDMTVTELAFSGNGNTFLDHIARTIQAQGDPEAHRYVEIVATETQVDSPLWQGEWVTVAESTILFLQAAQRGGNDAVQIDIPASVSLDDTILAELAPLLPALAAPLDSAAPAIEFVNARKTSDAEDSSTWRFDVTIRYPDTGWDDYADGWHVETPDGEILGTRILLHPHTTEQPFTRSLSNVTIANDLSSVLIRAHDLVSGYSDETVEIPLTEAVETASYSVAYE